MALLEVIYLDDDTSTDPTAYTVLPPGEWLFSLDTANAAASVTIDKQRAGSSNDRPVVKGGVPVALTTLDSDVIETSKGDAYRVTNASGASAATVTATRVPTVTTPTYR